MAIEIIPLMVVIPLAGAVLLNLVHGKNKLAKAIALLIGIILLTMPFMSSKGVHQFGAHFQKNYDSNLTVAIKYRLQDHSRIMIFTLALILFLVIASYTSVYSRVSGPYLGFMMLGVAATSAAVMAKDFFNFYIFMEIALLSQTALALSQATLESFKASVKYLIIANIAGNSLLISIALLLSFSGSLNYGDIVDAVSAGGINLATNPVFLVAAALATFAWLYASGIFPFHNIKSELYGSAKPHAAALMQTQTKFIMIALALMILKIFSPVLLLRPFMLFMACGAMIFGVIMALKQDDYKRMLSYHAISQGGYVAAGLALGTPMGIMAGIFHAINHVIYKTALFLGCEIVAIRRGSTRFKDLGGSIFLIPLVAFLVLCAKFAISGIPPFNGFQSKLSLIMASFKAGQIEVSIIMVLVSVLTFISMMKAFHLVYLRPKEENMAVEERPLKVYVLALIVLVTLMVIIGVYPTMITDYIWPIASNVGKSWRF